MVLARHLVKAPGRAAVVYSHGRIRISLTLPNGSVRKRASRKASQMPGTRPGDPNWPPSYARAYTTLRAACIDLEMAIGEDEGLTAKQAKRLDKSITVMKAGFKMMKKAMKNRTAAKLRVVA